MTAKADTLYLAVIPPGEEGSFSLPGLEAGGKKHWCYFYIDDQRCSWLISSQPAYLYMAWTYIKEQAALQTVKNISPWFKKTGFTAEKSTFDLFLTQYARMIRGFKREEYIREYARLGFTHIEVNGLASDTPAEKGIPGEFYPDFYTYCPALDQFVASRLNQGLYPREYLQANLDRLKENAATALKYGLVPGLLCFEPRSVPEKLFEKYPTLRGPRVDHPFRSFKPRFGLALNHPLSQQHYAELVLRLMQEVPELGFLSIWTNDSGAGFEHTKSLYVGRNGGAYMIREWKDDKAIAASAAANIAGFFKLLRDEARKINPDFKVISRLEPFYGEMEFLWPELSDGIVVEGNSLLTTGWETNYPHPRFPDVKVLGSALHNNLTQDEKKRWDELKQRGSDCFFYHFLGSHTNHEPLLGIPFPWLVYEKLKSAHLLGLPSLAHLGGIHPPDKVPFAVNQEVFRRFQLDPEKSADLIIEDIARTFVGLEFATELLQGWRWVDEAVRSFTPLSIYSHYGVVWQRLFVRPLVPDIGLIPEGERIYYESRMCSSQHNPNRVDLAQDVLFILMTKEKAAQALERINAYVWSPLDKALSGFKHALDRASGPGKEAVAQVFEDQYFRIRALRALYETLRNTAEWIYLVHTYPDGSAEKKAAIRKRFDLMMDREITNCEELVSLWENAPVEWMIISRSEETPFIYGDNLGELLRQKITLMQNHRDHEPFFDPDFMYHVPNDPYKSLID